MNKSTSNANSGSVKEPGEVSNNPRDLISKGLGMSNEPETTEEPVEETEVVEEVEEVSEEAETTEETTEETEEESKEEEGENINDVLSQYDFTALSDEEAEALGKWFSDNLGDKASVFGEGYGSGAGKEFGKLRGAIREKESTIESLQAQLKEATDNFQPSDNTWSKVNDLDELATKEQEVRANIKAANEFLSGDESYITVQGEDYDRKTVSQWLDHYIKQMGDIPVQRQRIKELKSIDSNAEFKKAKEEIDWLSDEGSDSYKAYQELIGDTDIQLFSSSFPKTGAKLKRLLAHAVNSMSSPKVKTPNISLTKRNPSPSNTVSTGAGASSRQSGDKRGKVRDKAFEQIRSGNRKEGVRNLIAASI